MTMNRVTKLSSTAKVRPMTTLDEAVDRQRPGGMDAIGATGGNVPVEDDTELEDGGGEDLSGGVVGV